MKQFTSLNDGIWLVCGDVILWMAGFQFSISKLTLSKFVFLDAVILSRKNIPEYHEN